MLGSSWRTMLTPLRHHHHSGGSSKYLSRSRVQSFQRIALLMVGVVIVMAMLAAQHVDNTFHQQILNRVLDQRSAVFEPPASSPFSHKVAPRVTSWRKPSNELVAAARTQPFLAMMLRYIEHHSERDLEPAHMDDRDVVIFLSNHGTGNRMTALTGTFIMAVLSNRRFYGVWDIHPTYHECWGNMLFEYSFPWSVSDMFERHSMSAVREQATLLHFHGPIDAIACSSVESALQGRYPMVLTDENFMSLYYKHPLYSHLFTTGGISEDTMLRLLLEYLLVPTKLLRTEIDRTFLQGMEGHCEAALHVRRHGSVPIPDSKMHKPVACAIYAAKQQQQRASASGSHQAATAATTKPNWFVATDAKAFFSSTALVEFGVNVSMYPGQEPLSDEEVSADLVSAAHWRRCMPYQNAVIEMYLASKCQLFVGTPKSSFSAVISSLTGVPHYYSRSLEREGDELYDDPAVDCVQAAQAHPCYLEMLHVRSTACYDPAMLEGESCCAIGGLCDHWCMHHYSIKGQWAPIFFWILTWPWTTLLSYLITRLTLIVPTIYVILRWYRMVPILRLSRLALLSLSLPLLIFFGSMVARFFFWRLWYL